MPKYENTFWTKFDDTFYRIKDNKLYQAPVTNDSIDTDNSTITTSISSAILEEINHKFGSNFSTRDFN